MTIKEQKPASELMPKSEEALRILRTRANQLAKEELDTHETSGISFIRFTLNLNESYGVPYQYVQDILSRVTIAKPPFIPPFVAGVSNWRGSLITVIDLDRFFHPHHARGNDVYVIVINAQNITLGLLVNHVESSEEYQPSQLSLPLSSKGIANPEYVLGLHQGITAILNIETLVSGLNQEIKKNLYCTLSQG